MADFCLQCANELFGSDDAPVKSDFHGLLSKEDFYKGYVLPVLCEGCGIIDVDPLGKRVDDSSNNKETNVIKEPTETG